MKKEELVSKLVEALQCYYSPVVMVGTAIFLTMLHAQKHFNSAILEMNETRMKELENCPYIEEKDELCLGLTVRLYEHDGTYVILFGEPDTDKWFNKAYIVHKHKVDPFPVEDFERPDTH